MSNKINILSPFGPKLAKIKLTKKIIKDINNEVERVILNEKKLRTNDYSKKLVGEVYQEIELSKNFINKKLKKFIQEKIKNYLKKTINKTANKISIKNFWVVRQFKNEYNPVHYHSGHVSGAGYLKVPKNLGKFIQNKDKQFQGGDLNLIHGSRQFLSRSIFPIKPKVGDFYFFPNYLMNTVYPFNGTAEERRSISFNANIDEKIFNQVS